jgi:hypothetical protein
MLSVHLADIYIPWLLSLANFASAVHIQDIYIPW